MKCFECKLLVTLCSSCSLSGYYPTDPAIKRDSSTILATATHPLSLWHVWVIDVTQDGTHGTQPWDKCGRYFCDYDYPYLGNDEHGIYLTTNIFGNEGVSSSNWC